MPTDETTEAVPPGQLPLVDGWGTATIENETEAIRADRDYAEYTGSCALCGDEVVVTAYYDRYESSDYNARQYFLTAQVGYAPLTNCEAELKRGVLCEHCRSMHRVECGRGCGHDALRTNVVLVEYQASADNEQKWWCPGCYNAKFRRGYMITCDCGLVVCTDQDWVGRDPPFYCRACGHERNINTGNTEVLKFKDRTVTQLAIGTEPQRPISRLMSLEIEMDGRYESMVEDMADKGWCDGRVNSYHSSGRSGHPVHFESDASVSVEMILPYLNMVPRSPSLHVVRECMKRVNKSVERGEVHFSMNTGMHVHIDAHNFHPLHVRGLYLLWCYLEDVIFRVSSVGYRCHRLAGSNSYACVLDKDRMEEVIDAPNMFGTLMSGMTSHSSGMNFGNYISNSDCRCGAVQMGKHEECTCTLGKNTIEFRVPNGTGNLTKVYTYLFMFHNMMNVAQYHPEAVKKLGKLTAFEYTKQAPSKEHRGRYKTRLNWMFDHLCYNKHERDALLQCVRKSDMASVLTSQYLDSLADRECILPAVEDSTPYEKLKMHRFPRLERA